ncbi:unnamed protein product, partial [Mesorhabditis belari]|uniref:Uncharacterized protein n=1 Tax=Mesorhabditis belari TaxID=2138241 RepID=A0AAF3EII4_9BILA
MIASSSFTVINYIIVDILSILVELFFGHYALTVLQTCTDLMWALFFHLGLSLISCLCFRKRKEKPTKVISITQINTRPSITAVKHD